MVEFSCPFKTAIGTDICKSIPGVTYRENWDEGGTGYIDGIKPKDPVFQTEHAVRFVDGDGRSGIAFRYIDSCQPEREFAAAAFQKYTDHVDLWQVGGHYAGKYIRDALNHKQHRILNSTALQELLSQGTLAFDAFVKYDRDSKQDVFKPCEMKLVVVDKMELAGSGLGKTPATEEM